MADIDELEEQIAAAERARLHRWWSIGTARKKHVWRARIILLTADGLGAVEIMRRADKSKTCVWRSQDMIAGVDGLLSDKTPPSRVPPLPTEVIGRVIALTRNDPPGYNVASAVRA